MMVPAARVPQEPCCTDGYERLRRQVVGPGRGAQRCGLALLLRQGVAAWLASLAELSATPPAPQPHRPLPAATEAEAIDILLAMARQHLQV